MNFNKMKKMWWSLVVALLCEPNLPSTTHSAVRPWTYTVWTYYNSQTSDISSTVLSTSYSAHMNEASFFLQVLKSRSGKYITLGSPLDPVLCYIRQMRINLVWP